MPDYRRNNPILQALHTSAKLSENTSQKIARGYKDYAVARFFNGLRQLDKPPDYDAARKRALDAYMTPEGKAAATSAATKNESATTSGDAATLAAVADKIATGARRIEMQNYLAQVDHMERNELKRQYIQRNLGLISQMDPGEQSALAMGAGGSAAALTDASSGFLARMMGGRGGMGDLGDGAKNEWTTIEVMQDGKRIIARMNKDTGEIIPTGFGGVGGGTGGGGGADQTAKVYDIGKKKVMRVNMAGRTIEEMAALARAQGGTLTYDPEGVEGWIGIQFNGGGGGRGGAKPPKALTNSEIAMLNERAAAIRRAQADFDAAKASGDADALKKATAALTKAKDDYNARVNTPSARGAGWVPSGTGVGGPVQIKIGSPEYREAISRARKDPNVGYARSEEYIRNKLAATGTVTFIQ